ncbi:hypothetical protein HPP92_015059 [Vanilla planifolia]|uniref:CCT domain-containing protein n=1 Tax=Vanilla planifolia TaxID=51239 RepID=A0A835UVE9_VANPL|nr:hypothetical protein HPP92_015571 [Vanilla planifolia]KAG0475373.1 hypothetical protein HPP92_015059 [Vanilla planifolia]
MFNSSSSSSTSPPLYISSSADTASYFDTNSVDHHVPAISLLSSSSPSSYSLHRGSTSHSFPLPSRFINPHKLVDFTPEPIRRVFSTGDLQCINGSFASSTSSLPESAVTTMSTPGKVGRYSAEERRERIERYRSKRNQRNFNKKITYACRKTLADGRQRVRGRFARNGEAEAETESTGGGLECWNTCRDAGEGGAGNWFITQMEAALLVADEEELGCDEDLWAGLDDVFSMNLSSSFSSTN